MSLQAIANALVALSPVLVFLGALVYLDSFKLVSLGAVIGAIAVGGAAAGLSYSLNGQLLDLLRMEFVSYSRYASPWLEESLKAALLVYLIRSRRVGMLVDAAIYGFAIGSGFALVENFYYLATRPDAHIAVQVIRGFGTAIMHGGATAIFAIVSVGTGGQAARQRISACSCPACWRRRRCTPASITCWPSRCWRLLASCWFFRR